MSPDRIPRRARRALATALTLAVGMALPSAISLASHQFTDVPASSPYHGDIAAIRDAGVTTGCGGGRYCPKDTVTREQMAAFMNRLGALSPGKPPVVNANRLDGRDSTDLMRNAIWDVTTEEGPAPGPWATQGAPIQAGSVLTFVDAVLSGDLTSCAGYWSVAVGSNQATFVAWQGSESPVVLDEAPGTPFTATPITLPSAQPLSVSVACEASPGTLIAAPPVHVVFGFQWVEPYS